MTAAAPWVDVKHVCHIYGVTYPTAKNKISSGTFPVPTYKVGKKHVIDRAVHQAYFDQHRSRGMAALRSTDGTRDNPRC